MTSSVNKLKYIFLSLIIIVLSNTQLASSQLVELNDSNFHEVVLSNPNNWFVIFTIPTCPHCKKAKELLSKVADELETEDYKIAEINCDQNHSVCMSFEIRHVPFMIKVLNDKYIKFESYPNKENVIEFMEMSHMENEMLELPAQLGYLNLFLRVFSEAAKMISDWINIQLKERNIDIEINSNHAYFFMLFCLSFMILTEVIVIICCCGPKKSKKVTNNVNKEIKTDTKDSKGDKDDKSVISKETEMTATDNKEESNQDPIEKKNN